MKTKLDVTDMKLLAMLQENARYSLKQLAAAVFLSSPAVSARIQRLENMGVITGYQAMIDPDRLGYHITAFVQLELTPEMRQAFYHFTETCEQVKECYCVTGSYRVILKVTFPGTVDLDAFVERLQQYGRTSTQIVFPMMGPGKNIQAGAMA